MIVSLKRFKNALTNTKKVVSSGGLDGGLFVQLRCTEHGLFIGGRSDAVSYETVIAYDGDAAFQTIYISLYAVQHLILKTTKDDILTLSFSDGDLHFSSALEDGIVQATAGVSYARPQFDFQNGSKYMVLGCGTFLKQAIKHVKDVKRGWKVSNRPYAASFIRLAVYNEDDFREEEDSVLPHVCRFLLNDVTSDQEKATEYASSLAFSVFSSDDQRYYQSFEPVYIANHFHELDGIPISMIMDDVWVGKPLHLMIKDAEILESLLTDEAYRIDVLLDGNTPEALLLFNGNTRIWVRLYRGRYPDVDFNRQLAFFTGDVIATFTPDDSFIAAVKAAVKLKSTGEHGLTIRVSDGKIFVSSPENSLTVRYGDLDADVTKDITVIVNGIGFESAITKDELILVVGEDITAIYNATNRSRVVLRNLKR